MSITPFNFDSEWKYTVLGSHDFQPRLPDFSFTGIVLPYGPRYFQIQAAERLLHLGAGEVLLFMESDGVWQAEDTSGLGVRFIRPDRPMTHPELLNLAMNEARGEWALVLYDNMEVLDPFPPQKLLKNDKSQTPLVWLPELKDTAGVEFPSLIVPLRKGSILQFQHLLPRDELLESLIPHNLSGLYRPSTFFQTGGFDSAFPGGFWQKMDWGFRIHLWGESIRHLKGFRIQYTSQPPPEDMSPRSGYGRFFLKNIAPRFLSDHAQLATRHFWTYLLGSGLSPFKAWKEFRRIQDWVEKHKYRFRTDAQGLKDLWGSWK